MPLYRLDREGEPYSDGSIPVYTQWMGGLSLAAIRNCRVDGTDLRRSVRITGEPDTFFSQPAQASIGGKNKKGFIMFDDDRNPLPCCFSGAAPEAAHCFCSR